MTLSNQTEKPKREERLKEFAVEIRKMIGEDEVLEGNENQRSVSNGMMINGLKDIYRGRFYKILEMFNLDPKEVIRLYQKDISSKKESK